MPDKFGGIALDELQTDKWGGIVIEDVPHGTLENRVLKTPEFEPNPAIATDAGPELPHLGFETNEPMVKGLGDFLVGKPDPELQSMAEQGNKHAQAILGVQDSLRGTVESLTTPESVAMLGGGGAAMKIGGSLAKVAGGAFLGLLAKSAPEIGKQLGEEYGKPPEERDTAKLAKAWTDAATVAGMAGAVGVGMRRGKPAETIQEDAILPDEPIAPETPNTPAPEAAIPTQPITERAAPPIAGEIPPEKGAPIDASQVPKATEVHGPMRPLETSSEIVPIERSGEGVQLQTETGIPAKEVELIGMGGATPAEFTKEGSFVSNMFAAIDADRVAMGKPPMEATKRRTWDEDNARALARMNRAPDWIPKLLDDVKANPRPLMSWENAGVVWHRQKLKAEYNNSLQRIAQAFDDGRTEDLSAAKSDAEIYENQLQKLDETVGRGGTGSEAGRSLVAQKMAAGDDFSLVEMRLQSRKDNGGRPLTDKQSAEIQAIHDGYQAKLKELEIHLATQREKLVDEEIKRAFAESKVGPSYEPRVLKYAEQFASYMDKQGAAALGRIKEKLARTSAGVDPTILADVSIYGAAKITRGLTNFAKWSETMIADVGEWIKPHLQEAWDASQKKFEDTLTKVSSAKPEIADKVKRAVKKMDASEKIAAARESIEKKVVKGTPDAIFNEVQKIIRAISERDPKITREPLIDEVHAILQEYIPEITRLETMDAISGRGRFTIPRQDEISKNIRDLKTQIRLVAHQIDVEARRPLPRTGYQRGKLSDLARQEEQRLNELKKKFGVVVTDPAQQLASALTARKTYYRNRLADLALEIRTRERIVKTKTPPPVDAELNALKAEHARLKAEHAEIFQKPGLTDVQRLAASEKAADRQIAELQRQLKSGSVFPESKTPSKLTSAALEAKRSEIESLKAERDWVRDLLQPKMDPVDVALKNRKAQMTRKMAEWAQRMADNDYLPRQRKKLDISQDKDAMRIQGEMEQFRKRYEKSRALNLAKQRSKAAKIYAGVKEVLNLPKAMWSAFDISAVGRQGGFIGAGHPIRAAKSLGPMFRAMASEKAAFAIEQEILNRPNAQQYADSKLYLANLDEFKLTRQEEIMMSRFANAIPGVRMSNRAFMTYLNKLRADSFDALVSRSDRFSSRPLELPELKAIANYINVATGRGDLGKLAGLAEGLATVFWSPRLVTSRFQLLLGQPLWKGTMRTRALIAAEYAQSLSGLAVIIGLGSLAGATVETDPNSADFLKLRFGDTRVDIFGGLIQNTVLLSRFVSGVTKTSKGKEIPAKAGDLAANFLRSKLAPALGQILDTRDILLEQKPPPGHPQDFESLAKRAAVPLAWQDILDLMEDQGVPRAIAFEILSLFGAGVQHYEDTKK